MVLTYNSMDEIDMLVALHELISILRAVLEVFVGFDTVGELLHECVDRDLITVNVRCSLRDLLRQAAYSPKHGVKTILTQKFVDIL